MISIEADLDTSGEEIILSIRVFEGVGRAEYTEFHRLTVCEAEALMAELIELTEKARVNIASREGKKLTELRNEHALIGEKIKRMERDVVR